MVSCDTVDREGCGVCSQRISQRRQARGVFTIRLFLFFFDQNMGEITQPWGCAASTDHLTIAFTYLGRRLFTLDDALVSIAGGTTSRNNCSRLRSHGSTALSTSRKEHSAGVQHTCDVTPFQLPIGEHDDFFLLLLSLIGEWPPSSRYQNVLMKYGGDACPELNAFVTDI